MIERALADARQELDALYARENELRGLIARAEAALGKEPPQRETNAGPLTLHEALAQLLRENANRWMTVHELAAAVNDRRLYSKRDGTPVEANQVHARTNNYRALFEKDGPNIRLREET